MTTPASRQTREHYAANPVMWLSLLLILTGVMFWGVLKIYFITELRDFSALALPVSVGGLFLFWGVGFFLFLFKYYSEAARPRRSFGASGSPEVSLC